MPVTWNVEDVKDWKSVCYWRMTIREYATLFNKKDTNDLKSQLRTEWPKPSFYLIDKSVKPDDITDDTLVGRMDPVCKWLIFDALPRTGHMKLTLDNVGDVYKRLSLMGQRNPDLRPQRVVDARFRFGDITMDELLKFIGVYNNGYHSSVKSVTAFCKAYRIDRKDWRNWSPPSRPNGCHITNDWQPEPGPPQGGRRKAT
tara:strand:+ start:43 stop:642 length:600 start_codon:yes stop_codon:yes gene_type:complete